MLWFVNCWPSNAPHLSRLSPAFMGDIMRLTAYAASWPEASPTFQFCMPHLNLRNYGYGKDQLQLPI